MGASPLDSAVDASAPDGRIVPSPDGLRHLARDAGLLFGAAVDPALLCDAHYAKALAADCSMLEPENALKWYALRPSRDAFCCDAADEVLSFAEANGQRVRGHVLAWHAYLPSWLRRGKFTPTELERIMREHIEAVLARYRGRVFAWDVLNEAFTDSPAAELRSSIWYDRPGMGFGGMGVRYAEQLFCWAREADAAALLFYNDDVQHLDAKFEAVYRMLEQFRARDVPIDGVGLQLHLDLTTSLTRLDEYIGRLGELRLQVHVTELDVALDTDADGAPRDPDDLWRQAAVFDRVVTACLAQPHCTAIQTWGVSDAHSWIPTFTRGRFGAPLLRDGHYEPKPAWHTVRARLAGARSSRMSSTCQVDWTRYLA